MKYKLVLSIIIGAVAVFGGYSLRKITETKPTETVVAPQQQAPAQLTTKTYSLERNFNNGQKLPTTRLMYTTENGEKGVAVEDFDADAARDLGWKVDCYTANEGKDEFCHYTYSLDTLSLPAQGDMLYFTSRAGASEPNWPSGIYAYNLISKKFSELKSSSSFNRSEADNWVVSPDGTKLAASGSDYLNSKHILRMAIFDLTKDTIQKSPYLAEGQTFYIAACDYGCELNVKWLDPRTIEYGVYAEKVIDQVTFAYQLIETRRMTTE